jgi:hypothetical protein
MMLHWLPSLQWALILSLGACGSNAEFNNPAGVDIWCGKAYRATYVLRHEYLPPLQYKY